MQEIDALKSLRWIVLVKGRNTARASEYVEKYRMVRGYLYSLEIQSCVIFSRGHIHIYPTNLKRLEVSLEYLMTTGKNDRSILMSFIS